MYCNGSYTAANRSYIVQEAAQQLKIGLSVLKRICRQMGLARWPYRTRQSLRGVIAKTQEYYMVSFWGLLAEGFLITVLHTAVIELWSHCVCLDPSSAVACAPPRVVCGTQMIASLP